MSESPNYPSTTIPTEYAIEFLKVAWGVLKQSYGILFLVGVIGLAANLIANLIPFIGTLAYSAASPFLIAGALNVARKAFETGNAEFDDFTKPLNDKDLLSRLIPVSIFSAALTPQNLLFLRRHYSNQRTANNMRHVDHTLERIHMHGMQFITSFVGIFCHLAC